MNNNLKQCMTLDDKQKEPFLKDMLKWVAEQRVEGPSGSKGQDITPAGRIDFYGSRGLNETLAALRENRDQLGMIGEPYMGHNYCAILFKDGKRTCDVYLDQLPRV